MTHITIDRKTWAITADGHAGYVAGGGIDQVCCAISTLMQALLYAGRRMGYEMSHEIRDGYLMVQHVRGSGPMTMDLLGAFNCTALGLEMIQAAYPGHVCIELIW